MTQAALHPRIGRQSLAGSLILSRVGMHINVSQLLKEPSGSTRSFTLDDRVSLMELPETARVSGTVEMLRTDRGIWASAALESAVPATCSMCTAEFEQSVDVLIGEEFFPRTDILDGARVDPADDDTSTTIDSQHVLDLTEVVMQYAAISLPMKLVCREDCAGICVDCGTALNESRCKCEPEPRDDRSGPLLEIAASDRESS